MQRQRGELVPIGAAVSGLDDVLVPAIRNDSPQARHHFTVADQVHQLVTAREADPDRGFMARLMALCSLPRTTPATRKSTSASTGRTRSSCSQAARASSLLAICRAYCWPGCVPKRYGLKNRVLILGHRLALSS